MLGFFLFGSITRQNANRAIEHKVKQDWERSGLPPGLYTEDWRASATTLNQLERDIMKLEQIIKDLRAN